jgi:hypothetical protein
MLGLVLGIFLGKKSGLTGGGGGNIAPFITTGAYAVPSAPSNGAAVTFYPPAAGGLPAPSVVLTSFTKNGVDDTASLTYNAGTNSYSYPSIGVGSYVALWTASNGVGSDATSQLDLTVSSPVVSTWRFDSTSLTFDSTDHTFDEA